MDRDADVDEAEERDVTVAERLAAELLERTRTGALGWTPRSADAPPLAVRTAGRATLSWVTEPPTPALILTVFDGGAEVLEVRATALIQPWNTAVRELRDTALSMHGGAPDSVLDAPLTRELLSLLEA